MASEVGGQQLTLARVRGAFAMQKSALGDVRRDLRAARLARSQEIAERTVRKRFLAREREIERGIRAYWIALKRKVRITPTQKRSRPKSPLGRIKLGVPSGLVRLPRYEGPILDSKGRRGVFMSVEYFGARRTRFGVGRRMVVYITRELGVEHDAEGKAIVLSNVGEAVDEIEAAFELVEVVNRGARGNGKLLFSMIVGLPHDLPSEARREIMQRFAAEAFEPYDLPYCGAVHEAPPDGDKRNTHGHFLFALRPMARTGDHQWEVGRELLTEHDCKERFYDLRKTFSEVMTDVSREYGKSRRSYTHLSNVARGLKAGPQEKLGAAATAMVLRGEDVAANLRNQQRVEEGQRLMAADRAQRRINAPLAIVNRIRRKLKRLITPILTDKRELVLKASSWPSPPDLAPAMRIGSLPASTDQPAIKRAPMLLLPRVVAPTPTVRTRGSLFPSPPIDSDGKGFAGAPASSMPTVEADPTRSPIPDITVTMSFPPSQAAHPAPIRASAMPHAGASSRTLRPPITFPGLIAPTILEVRSTPSLPVVPAPSTTALAAAPTLTIAIPDAPRSVMRSIGLRATGSIAYGLPDVSSHRDSASRGSTKVDRLPDIPKIAQGANSVRIGTSLLDLIEHFDSIQRQREEAKAKARARQRAQLPRNHDVSR